MDLADVPRSSNCCCCQGQFPDFVFLIFGFLHFFSDRQ